MVFLNYHHLRYFRYIAREGNLTRAAEMLRLSPSALSIQLRQLEESLGQTLFERDKGRLTLTPAGRVALEYAETIHRAGEELVGTMRESRPGALKVLRVGAVATLSRNFLLEFLRPAMHSAETEVVVRSGGLRESLARLATGEVDVVLSNRPATGEGGAPWHTHALALEPVSLVATPALAARPRRFPEDFSGAPVILPSEESDTRLLFERLCESAGVRPRIIAEVDDMAMLRLFAREGEGYALVPPVVVRDEIEAGALVETHRLEGLRETFYAITLSRKFQNPIVASLVARIKAAKADAPAAGSGAASEASKPTRREARRR